METLEEKIKRVVAEEVDVVPYDPRWPELFEEEKAHLLSCLPKGLLKRVEHFGGAAVPGLCAKPIVDILVEVSSLDETREKVPPILEAQGYDYFWRPMGNENVPPYYAWFIKRGERGERTHHIHMVDKSFERWDRLYFRDWLRTHPEDAKAYGDLKTRLAKAHPSDRIAYTEEKRRVHSRSHREGAIAIS
jgi:GrpB-like predicted nucleotidyltransferase (UPF0157 family)